MYAKLTDGRTVELEKDCECITHDGPHWLHMDRIDKELNAELLARGDYLSLIAFAQGESRRLDEKLRNMESRKISELISQNPV